MNCQHLDQNGQCRKGDECTYPACLGHPAVRYRPAMRYGLLDANWGDRNDEPDHWNRHGRGEL